MADKEYIEREAAFEYNEQCKKCFHFQVCANILKRQLFIREKILAEENPKCIDYVPTADVVEVRHGEWIEHPHFDFSGAYSGAHFECSACHYDELYDIGDCNYCPVCGVKMDGKDVDS